MRLTTFSENAMRMAIKMNEAGSLLQQLERQRSELGPVADELIFLLREAGITPREIPKHSN